jgi:hypothetical protein
MIKQFRNLTPINIFYLIVIAIVLRAGMFLHLPGSLEFNFVEPFFRLLLDVPAESPFMPLANLLIATGITIVQALIFNRVINEYNLLGKPSFLPALMYITTSSILMPFMLLNPAMLCNFLLIWMIEKFLSISRRNHAISVMFDMGLMVGIGTLIYFPFISMFFLLFVSLLIFRPFNWREWVVGLIGFATVYFFLAVFYFWNDSLDKFYQIWIPLTNTFPTKIRINFYDYIVLIPLLVILVLSVFSLRKNFFRSYVHTRKSLQLLFFLFVLAIVSFYLKPEVRIFHFLLAVPAVSVFMAYYFLHATKKWIYESLYLLLVGFIIYFQLM